MKRVVLLIVVVSIGLPGNRDVLAADRATPTVLNNLVTEVVNARRHGLLEEKTRGNLTESEDGLLKSLLRDLRMRTVALESNS